MMTALNRPAAWFSDEEGEIASVRVPRLLRVNDFVYDQSAHPRDVALAPGGVVAAV